MVTSSSTKLLTYTKLVSQREHILDGIILSEPLRAPGSTLNPIRGRILAGSNTAFALARYMLSFSKMLAMPN